MYCILLQQSPSYVGVNELHLCRQLTPVHIDILFQREECLLKFISYIPYCIQSVHNFLNRPCMSTSCYASLCQSLTTQWLLLLSPQLYWSLTNYSITLRMATCFNHTSHHQAINCYKNVNLKILRAECTEVIDVWWDLNCVCVCIYIYYKTEQNIGFDKIYTTIC
jgi:hypothetical protein